MITPGSANPLLLGGEGYQISRSLRLRSSASAYFNRTPASATNQTTWTISKWAKLGALNTLSELLNCFNAAQNKTAYLRINADNTLTYFDYNATGGVFINQITTTQVFRDPSAWYHIVMAYDTGNATASDRLRLYINGVRVTALSTASYPTLNYAGVINTAALTTIGRYSNASTGYFDGYLTEVNFIDGQALTPSAFGQTDPVTGVWGAKKYAGTYGANGFYLNFSDPSAATAAAIGKDYSGNGNNWTPNGISVTAGTSYDSMLDVPTMWADGGNGRGNYCVLNPLQASAPTLSAGNLTTPSLSAQTVYGTVSVNSGKWYWEGKCAARATGTTYVGVENSTYGLSNQAWTTSVFAMQSNSQKYLANVVTSYGAGFAAGDTIGVALDVTNDTLEFFVNGTSQGLITSVGMAQGNMRPMFQGNTATWEANFGQRPFAYTPPTGFKALNTQNLPDATIKAGNKYFDASLYTGTNASLAVVNPGFQPDLVWMKRRNLAATSVLIDSVRGLKKGLNSDTTNAEGTATSGSGLISFDAGGFTIGTEYDGGAGSDNASGSSYVAWNWKKGVSQGFDIVTYTGTGANATVAHSLGVAPKMLIVKSRNGTGKSWNVWHTSIAATEYLYLESTAAKATDATKWNSTLPSSSVFSLGSAGGTNASGENFVAYLFAEVAGFSKFGSYTGNGSADGPFVYLGFRPKFVMYKRTDSTGDWAILDSSRSTYNVQNDELYPDSATAETAAGAPRLDSLSNGFKIRNAGGAAINANGGTYIYAAFAENPFKNSLAR